MPTFEHDSYWDYLQDPRILRQAAHLVDKDSWADFQDSFLERQVFAYARDAVIEELASSLRGERYVPSPATPVLVPKSTFSQRPGLVVPYRDRVLLTAITMCLAPKLDPLLNEGVWSWRVKKSLRGKGPAEIPKRGIFRETDITQLPFLKRRTVLRRFDDFEPWYALWPHFQRRTQQSALSGLYPFMVISDIAAYFENIQLGLLHNLLNRYAPDAPNTINLLMRHLRTWRTLSYDGSTADRGIPQGNSTSSFLGNFLLKPVDDYFASRFTNSDIVYYRYMDDIRILARSESVARAAALALETEIRRSKLNLQSAKTEVVTSVQALRMITDRRLDDLDDVKRLLKNPANAARCRTLLDRIAADPGNSVGSIPIRRSRPPLSGINLRVLRRWATYEYALGSNKPVDRMAREALANPDYRVTREVQRIAVNFPGLRRIPSTMWNAVAADQLNFAYQTAELFRGLKLFSHVPPPAFKRAYQLAVSNQADPYLRLNAVFLLARAPRDWVAAKSIVKSCLRSADTRVQAAGVLAASFDGPIGVRNHIYALQSHASPEIIKLIQYIRALRQDTAPARSLIDFVFGDASASEQRVYQFAGLLRFISTGQKLNAQALRDALRKSKARAGSPFFLLRRFLISKCDATLR